MINFDVAFAPHVAHYAVVPREGHVEVDRHSIKKKLDAEILISTVSLLAIVGLQDLIVGGPSLRLNDLRVVNCSDIERVDISLVKVAYLELVTGRPNLHLSIKPPHPARIYYDAFDFNEFWDTLTQFGSFVGLETLGMMVVTGIPQNLPVFRDLKKLDLRLFYGADLVGPLNLLNAAPRLEELVVTLLVENFCENQQQQIESFSAVKHDRLRKVKLQAFRSTPCEIEFVISILQITTKLEIMEIDPFGWWSVVGRPGRKCCISIKFILGRKRQVTYPRETKGSKDRCSNYSSLNLGFTYVFDYASFFFFFFFIMDQIIISLCYQFN
ncbi:uncharacterized protein LOC110764272 [Prunus avium]|uniref:Uncharacterized protein LOC110764272 n=1 Tax=Prunus avium TaxID=42229 RepID=A0A6P5T708_PRUAV|nr:uncharacterized protein LOC110764272 [Prunus avium]